MSSNRDGAVLLTTTTTTTTIITTSASNSTPPADPHRNFLGVVSTPLDCMGDLEEFLMRDDSDDTDEESEEMETDEETEEETDDEEVEGDAFCAGGVAALLAAAPAASSADAEDMSDQPAGGSSGGGAEGPAFGAPAKSLRGALDEIARAVLTVNWADLSDSDDERLSSSPVKTAKTMPAMPAKTMPPRAAPPSPPSLSTMCSIEERRSGCSNTAEVAQFRKPWDAWYDPPRGREIRQGIDGDSYERSLVRMGTVTSEDDFWHVHEMIDWEHLPAGSMVSFGEVGSKPFWEDPAHCNGGRWVIRGCPVQFCEDLFTQLVLSMFTDGFPQPDEFTCVSLQVKERRHVPTIQLWTRTRAYREAAELQRRVRGILAALQLQLQQQQQAAAAANMQSEDEDEDTRRLRRRKRKRGNKSSSSSSASPAGRLTSSSSPSLPSSASCSSASPLSFEFCCNSEAIQRNNQKLGSSSTSRRRQCSIDFVRRSAAGARFRRGPSSSDDCAGGATTFFCADRYKQPPLYADNSSSSSSSACFAASGVYDSHGCWYPPGSVSTPIL